MEAAWSSDNTAYMSSMLLPAVTAALAELHRQHEADAAKAAQRLVDNHDAHEEGDSGLGPYIGETTNPLRVLAELLKPGISTRAARAALNDAATAAADKKTVLQMRQRGSLADFRRCIVEEIGEEDLHTVLQVTTMLLVLLLVTLLVLTLSLPVPQFVFYENDSNHNGVLEAEEFAAMLKSSLFIEGKVSYEESIRLYSLSCEMGGADEGVGLTGEQFFTVLESSDAELKDFEKAAATIQKAQKRRDGARSNI